MIKYFFEKNNQKIEKIYIEGHSLYESKGKDIVCASISTAIIMTLNAIEIFGLNPKINYNLKTGCFSLQVLTFDCIVDSLLCNLEYTLKDLNKTYPKYLQKTKY